MKHTLHKIIFITITLIPNIALSTDWGMWEVTNLWTRWNGYSTSLSAQIDNKHLIKITCWPDNDTQLELVLPKEEINLKENFNTPINLILNTNSYIAINIQGYINEYSRNNNYVQFSATNSWKINAFLIFLSFSDEFIINLSEKMLTKSIITKTDHSTKGRIYSFISKCKKLKIESQ